MLLKISLCKSFKVQKVVNPEFRFVFLLIFDIVAMLVVWCPKYIFLFSQECKLWGWVTNLGKAFTIESKKTFPSYLPLCNGNELWCNLHYGKQEVVKVVLESRVILNTIPD
jgi:hypothetical protein